MDDRPKLGTPPGERYGARADPEPSGPSEAGGRTRPVTAAVAISLAGAVAISLLGGLLGVGAGLIVVAAFVGWLIATVLRTSGPALSRRVRLTLAIALAVGAVMLGQVGLWWIARLEGGVLDPIAYLAEVFGLLVPLELGAAIIAAAWAAR